MVGQAFELVVEVEGVEVLAPSETPTSRRVFVAGQAGPAVVVGGAARRRSAPRPQGIHHRNLVEQANLICALARLERQAAR
jgi:hypothetical protein